MTAADAADLVEALRREGVPDVDGSTLTRALYSSDASLYRVVPQVVARPRSVDELAATVAVARDSGTPLTMRGAGTSIAGNAVGPGIVVDTTRHLNRVLELDPDAGPPSSSPGPCTPPCSGQPPPTGCGSVPTRRRTPGARSAG